MSDVPGSEGMALSQEQINTAMQSPEHLRQWLDASERRWIVFNGIDLVEALPWPHGVELFMQLVMIYRDHRRAIWTGREKNVLDRVSGKEVTVKVYKGEKLEVEELDRAIRYLTAQILELDPSWSIEKPAL